MLTATRRTLALYLTLLTAALAAHADLPGYVAKPDAAFQWSKQSETPKAQSTLYMLKMTSQQWEGNTWEHAIQIVRPNTPTYPTTAVLVVTGGSPGKDEDALAATLANATGVAVAVLYNIPNQPLYGKHEDDLIAYTFNQYLETGDENWPLLFPMTKSAVRAMDAVQAFAKEQKWPEITHFIVAGASKRGWTTWLTGAVDPRVKAIVPMVYDNLNLAAQMPHQLESWGQYSEMIQAYTRLGIQQKMASERGKALSRMVDPYTFRQKLTMPKLIVNGTNDPYWSQDALNLYWDDLPAPKYVIYATNSGHGLENRLPIILAATAFVRGVASGARLPDVRWHYTPTSKGVILAVSAHGPMRSATLWTAHSDTRDFRKSTWVSRPMTAGKDGYGAEISKPTSGYTAVFAEATVEIGGKQFPTSTQIRILGH